MIESKNYSQLQKLKIERKRRKKRRIKRIICFLVVVSLIFIGVTVYKYANSWINFSKKLNVKTLEVPEYVTVDLIDVGLARTGVVIKEINNIVIHYTGNPGTTAQNNRDYFDKIDTTVCSHFVVGLDGEIIQCVPLDEKSAASNNRNLDTISIEVCHSGEDGKFNEKTQASLVKLTAWLCDNSNLSEKDVIRHYDITGKECPKYFVKNKDAWNDFLDEVKLELDNIKSR